MLAGALEKLNGKPHGKGDISFRIPMFRSLDVIFFLELKILNMINWLSVVIAALMDGIRYI
jgi:hypothetical protein